MSTIILNRLDASSDTATNLKARLGQLTALAPASLGSTDLNERTAEELISIAMLSAALRTDLSKLRAEAEKRLSAIIFAPVPPTTR